jgi:hypothetical protein
MLRNPHDLGAGNSGHGPSKCVIERHARAEILIVEKPQLGNGLWPPEFPLPVRKATMPNIEVMQWFPDSSRRLLPPRGC